MKFSLATVAACVSAVQAHAIFQKVSVNGKDMGQLTGIRAPSNNNPVMDVNSNSLTCGTPGTTSSAVIDVPSGARVGAYYGHIIGGAQIPNDPDHPIAASHKGPIQVYLAKVDNAASANPNSADWFKIDSVGFDSGSKKWAVDTLIQNQGWHYFNLPSCVAPGQYLMRVELLALHSASRQNQFQFYSSCAQINVSGSGGFSPSQTVKFPGAYTATDRGILVNIYGANGATDMSGSGGVYYPPGPAVINC
ncbi:uncharacterized protein PgNI_07727 [Pyricularia grisea]|uniref:lytic cellulose monooxygenase (C4-dehydrogenating) n=1 Tax=Pyricularia grisea TaxID=148305 RepID=A0A6P8B3L7_PYRGI|nr:uncharacterized protein PgNI_07727 [Pyricularia grisea]TLD09432.1 hypothetical protein PgNI_07727 [Pyricularia grisea]